MSKKLLIAKQYLNEKLGVTKREVNYESDLVEIEKKFETMTKFMGNLTEKLEELIQPNPQMRTKRKFKEQFDKLKKSGANKEECYPHVEGDIAKIASECGQEITGLYGDSLKELAEHFSAMSELKDKLDINLRVAVIDEINALKDTQIKDAQGCKKKLKSKRLQLEALHNQKNVDPTELKNATEKYNLSVIDAFNAYQDFSENTQENKIAQLLELAKELDIFYKGCSLLTGEMVTKLTENCKQASRMEKIQPKTLKDIASPKFMKEANVMRTGKLTNKKTSEESFNNSNEPNNPKVEENSKNEDINDSNDSFGQMNKGGNNLFYSQENVSNLNANFGNWNDKSNSVANINNTQTSKRRFIALFDMNGGEDDELAFKEGDIITMTDDIDVDWIEGELRGKIGIVPKNFIRQL